MMIEHGRRILSIDIETYSSRDLTKVGVYAYCEAEDFEILLFGYAFDDEEVRVVDLKSGEELPREVMEALTDEKVIKTSFNANFERICISAHFKRIMIIEQWRCSAVMALSLGLPGSLEGALKAIGLKEEKLKEGKDLIKYFSMAPKINNPLPKDYDAPPGDSRNFPQDNREKWHIFKDYCKRDVEVERALRKRLSKYRFSPREEKLWFLDQRINDDGILIDEKLLQCAMDCALESYNALREEAIRVTGIQNPNSNKLLKQWLYERDIEVESLNKEVVERLLKEDISEEVKALLRLKVGLSKTSIKKYEAMKRVMGKDKRVRGLFQFYGANRTGRWAGRLVQVHNLPKTTLKDVNLARHFLKSKDYKAIEVFYESIPKVLSELIRTAFIPREGSRFIIADFSAIEARVIAWLANERWRLQVFNTHGKIYEASASQMFKVPIDDITKESILREKGKIAELALGYQGSKGALIAMGALNMGIKEEEIMALVNIWRGSNRNIVRLWQTIERAAIEAVTYGTVIKLDRGLMFSMEDGILFVTLPSGRSIAYVNPRVERDTSFNKDFLTYEGMEQSRKRWERMKTYGGKLTENIVQAIARDCLEKAMLNLQEAGYKCVIHVHDEVVLEVPKGFGSIKEVEEIMGRPIEWAKDLYLRAKVNESEYYRKY